MIFLNLVEIGVHRCLQRYPNIVCKTRLEIAIGRIGRIVVSSCPETDYMQGSVTAGSSAFCGVLALPAGRSPRHGGQLQERAFRREGSDFEPSNRARSGREQP